MMSATMEFNEGTEVLSAGGDKLGTIERLVIDPRTREVTHLVLSKGFVLPEERVVSTDLVAVAKDAVVTLDEEIDLDDLPPFEETHYLPVGEGAHKRYYPTMSAMPLMWGFPYGGIVGTSSTHLMPPQRTPVTERNIPEPGVAVGDDADVVTADGEAIGSVAGVATDGDGRLVSIQVDPGWFREEQTIPAHFISSLDETTVELAVDAIALEAWRDAR